MGHIQWWILNARTGQNEFSLLCHRVAKLLLWVNWVFNKRVVLRKRRQTPEHKIPGSAFGAGVRIHKVRSTVFYPLGFMLRACKTKTVLLSVDVSFLPTRQTTVLFPTGFLKETNGTYIAQCVRPRGQRWCHYTSACLEPGPASPAEQIGTCEYEERRASDTQRWVSSKEGGEVWQQSQAHFAHWQLAHTVRT